MRLCCDENVRFSIYRLLEQEGYDVVRVQDDLELAAEDEDVLERCRQSDRVLLTGDDDFLDLLDHSGVFFLDEQGATPRDVVEAIKRVDELVPSGELAGETVYVPDGWI